MIINLNEILNDIEEIDIKIYNLNLTIRDEVTALSLAKDAFRKTLNKEVATIAAKSLKDKEYGCGTTTMETDLYKIAGQVTGKTKEGRFIITGCSMWPSPQDTPNAKPKLKATIGSWPST